MMYVPFCLCGSNRCHIKQSNRSMVNGINGKRQCLFPLGYEAKSTCPLDGKVNMARNPVRSCLRPWNFLPKSHCLCDDGEFPLQRICHSPQFWIVVKYGELRWKIPAIKPRAWWAIACHLQDGKPLSSLPAPPTDPALDVGILRWSSNRIHMDPPSSNYHTYRYTYR